MITILVIILSQPLTLPPEPVDAPRPAWRWLTEYERRDRRRIRP